MSTAAGAARPVVVIGDVGMDVVATPSGPIRYGTDTPAEVTMRRAGAGANTAAALASAGVDVTLIARVGDDSAGRTARAELEHAGVRCVWAVDRDVPTGLVVVLVDATGERTMLPSRGANAGLRVGDVVGALDVLAAFPGGMPHLHLSGYVLLDEGSRAAGLAALSEARRRGWTSSVDPQAAALVEQVGAGVFLEWVRGVDLLLPNAVEVEALGGVAAILSAVGAVALTEGAAGARWVGRDGTDAWAGAQTVPARDTTGAGDAFNAGLLAAWVGGARPGEALAAGVAAGTAVIAGRATH
ncbi:MAG TPA: PfkB family carbohydrate kinase [Dermatophilaceae bacterium]|nr:PfkB family carbohydrate kinase [Dermatophilaceae bacterium]